MLTKATLCLLTACVVSAAAELQSDWDQSARDHVLDIHNNYRRNEGGCQINKLEYDMELEAQAKQWAQGCVFEHEIVKGRGENLAYSTYVKPEAEMISTSAQAWFDEKYDYTPGQYGCQASCHYTQLVWHNTQKVGCYSNRCPYLQKGNKNAWYLVCFYTPMGNYVGQEPYKTSCDTPCGNGQQEENGLCVGEKIIPCVNNNVSCDGWAKRGECTKSPDYMNMFCRKACNLCS